MKKLFTSLVVGCLLLTGCSFFSGTPSKKGPNLVCNQQMSESGVYFEDVETFENDGTKVTKQTAVTKMTTEDGDVAEQLVAYYQDTYAKQYEGFEGVDYKASQIDDGVMFELSIDMEKVSNDTLIALKLLDSDAVDTKYIDLALTKESLEADGFTCSFDE